MHVVPELERYPDDLVKEEHMTIRNTLNKLDNNLFNFSNRDIRVYLVNHVR